MRVTSKGQVTIPQELRDKFGIDPGTDVDFRDEDGKLILVKRCGLDRGEELVQRLVASGRKSRIKLTTDEIMAMTRGEG